jgi:hypothetical protein
MGQRLHEGVPMKVYLKAFQRGISLLLVVTMLIVQSKNNPVLAAAGDVTRISVNANGVEGNDMSRFASISADGRYVAFESDANNLVSGDTNGTTDIFVKDRFTGEVSRVSVDSSGIEANNSSGGSAISADGRFVAFSSDATNLVANDTNGVTDIFLRDRSLGTTIIISVSSSGEQANNFSDTEIAISADGRFVVFQSDASNLVNDDGNGVADIFVRDTQTGTTELISRTSDGAVANGASFSPAISADGNIIAFTSSATNLDGNDTNGRSDVFIRRRSNGQTLTVSLSTDGFIANFGAREPSISADGRYVSFSSSATNLITEDTFSFTHIYIRDLLTNTTTLISRYSDGSVLVANTENASLSPDGRYIAFEFDDKGDGLPLRWIYVRDLALGLTTVATPRPPEDASPSSPAISNNGILVFHSRASNLVSNDTNGVFDVFAKEIAFQVDNVPTVSSLQPLCGVGCSPSASSISFSVTFSEAVTGVTADDFALTVTGSIAGASIIDVTGSGNTYTVNVNTGTGDGTIRVDVLDNDSIIDSSSNPLGGVGAGNGNFNTGGVYVIDKTLPTVTSITRADADPTENAEVKFNVTFSEAVTGVDGSDFTISTLGSISGVSISNVSGSGNLYLVTVNTGTGDGVLHIDLIDNDSIVDVNANPLGGVGAGNGNFTLGDSYTVDKIAPFIVSILRADVNPTAANVIRFVINFSEPVRGVDVNDFVLATTGVSGASITETSRADTVYTVTVNTGTGNGTIRLDVIDDDSIFDIGNRPLGGAGVGNGNFTGPTYTINKNTYVIQTERIRSNGTNDGWVLESNEDSNKGGSKNSTDTTFRIGDDAQDKQYRSILHFPTLHLPDNAVITKAILMMKVQSITGTDPFTTHGNIFIDIRSGPFGSFGPFGIKALQNSDFEAPASLYNVGQIQSNSVGGWYWAMLDPMAFSAIDKTGITQIRLAFQVDDNDDLGADFISFYSGDFVDQRDRPHLMIEYYVP